MLSPMQEALRLAQDASDMGEVPVGAVIACTATGSILTRAHNEVEQQGDATAHAEMLAVRRACARVGKILSGYSLYVTLEPCAMCAAAISHARLDALYFGAYDPKSGGTEHGARVLSSPTCHHKPQVYGGIDAKKAASLLTDFFKTRR